jgi:hypothetical protein
MSIYGTTFTVGFIDEPEQAPGVVLIRDNGENHWPSLDRNRRGALDGAAIPSWCVPGQSDDEESPGYLAPGPWYRLGGCSMRHEEGFEGEHLWSDQQYLLDEDAARALRDDLTRWLDLPKTRPIHPPGGNDS